MTFDNMKVPVSAIGNRIQLKDFGEKEEKFK